MMMEIFKFVIEIILALLLVHFLGTYLVHLINRDLLLKVDYDVCVYNTANDRKVYVSLPFVPHSGDYLDLALPELCDPEADREDIEWLVLHTICRKTESGEMEIVVEVRN